MPSAALLLPLSSPPPLSRRSPTQIPGRLTGARQFGHEEDKSSWRPAWASLWCVVEGAPTTKANLRFFLLSLLLPPSGKLTKGESVTTPDGRVVHPSECMGPAVPGPVFLLIECPSVAHLDQILHNHV